MRALHLHRWTVWGCPVSTDYAPALAQYRACVVCGLVQARILMEPARQRRMDQGAAAEAWKFGGQEGAL